MKRLTVRTLGPEFERRLREVARRRDTSLNKAALYLMRRGADLRGVDGQPPAAGAPLSKFRGTWTEADERAVLRSLQVDRRITGNSPRLIARYRLSGRRIDTIDTLARRVFDGYGSW